ncbi:kinase D-interacting substrate of 220 kDa B isoform X2 [Ischnura elegans]|uniref:kinase D-interacting substrate of 220 kDa B isoform X2 n=1 Tax=Ischnura elegans TaxID=197161 RepID=UPI001ED8BB3F|nr:kinase D-interacting substrate of 220 kDa B isoform X2 [Ischnura elegans]
MEVDSSSNPSYVLRNRLGTSSRAISKSEECITASSSKNSESRRPSVSSSSKSSRVYGSLLSILSFVSRHSKSKTLHNSESMASITFRSIVGFIQEDNLQGLQNFLDNKRVLVDDRDENNTTPLMVAVTKGKLTFVRELLNHGADVNAEDGDNWSALICAAKEGHTDIVAMLLDQGATLEHRDMGGWTALMWACYKGRTETAHLLLEKGADVAAHGNYHIPSLLWAAGRGHTQIVCDLLSHGAKPNIADKYGTSALVWACRKGHLEIVEALLKAGANVDAAGMYSWTPLLVATIGGFSDVVHRLLEHRPNTNAVDTDGCTALTHACKDGHMPIVIALLNAGAYINIQDRAGDTNLIHAVKGGHRGVVESLLKKYADVDIPGKDHKTAAYWAVEKNNAPMLRILLTANPDLEIATKDGDTALLRAVRVRSIELVQLLLDKKAKVTAADKKGDTALHIAMRARSKGIVEVLLRNPKNSQLLYRPNRASETPYNIDMSHQKTILSQIYGARRLNTSEDSEAMLGYDLYSSALADILSEPSLSLPITVGLYARWGSGKSFLLSKLREEMNNFARQWVDPVFQFSSMLFLAVCNIAMIGGAITGLASRSWVAGVSTGAGIVAVTYGLLLVVWYGSQRYDWYWPYNLNSSLTRKLNSLKLILQVMFCYPPGDNWSESLQAQPIRFYFSENTRVSNTTGGESSVVQMVASLYDAIEADYGAIPTRLYRAFRPRPLRATSSWRWRRVCCLPYVVIVVFTMMCFVALALCLSIYLRDIDSLTDPSSTERVSLVSTMSALGAVILVSILVNLRTWGRMAKALIFPHRTHLQRALRAATSNSSSGDSPSLRTGGFLHALRAEVATMTEMVRCLDGFCAQQQSRLVAIVDGLDACEQEKVLLVMDAVQVLISQAEARQAASPSAVASSSGGGNQSVSSSTAVPFIIILAIDPHVISRALEANLRRYGNEWGPGGGLSGMITGGTATATSGPGNVGLVGGMAYLRNIVHLPFFLQSSGPRRLRAAAALRQHGNRRRNLSECLQDEHSLRRLSTESGLSHTDRQRLSERSSITGERLRRKGTAGRLLPSESICSSLGSNLNRAGGTGGGGPFDLSKVLLADDYFSDVNPRSMRRLMNIVHVTGRLLKAFQVDFSWYHLANWVNVTEQWPFRISFLGLHCETHPNYEADTPLKDIYDSIKDQIPAWREVCPLVDLDREERKFDVFLTYHKASLHYADLQLFLPFTINLDPYIKKVIREEQQNMEDMSMPMMPPQHPMISGQWPVAVPNQQQSLSSTPLPWSSKSSLIRRNRAAVTPKVPPPGMNMVGHPSPMLYPGGNQWPPSQMGWNYMLPPQETFLPSPRPAPITVFPPELIENRLSTMSVSGVCDLLGRLPDIMPSLVPVYQETIKENNLSGRVIMHCDLDELKKVLKMNFGDWELFRMLVIALREQECVSVTQTDEVGLGGKYVRFASSGKSHPVQEGVQSSSSPRPYTSGGSSHSAHQLQHSSSRASTSAASDNVPTVHNVPSVSVTSPSSEQLQYNNLSMTSPNVDPALIASQGAASGSGKAIEIPSIGGSPVGKTLSGEVTRFPTVMETTLNQEAGLESQAKDSQALFVPSAKGSASTKSVDIESEGRNPKLTAEQRSQGGSLSHSSSSPPVSISGISSPPQMWLSKQHSQIEKQVMMEEEMICEALQALDRDTMADVLDEEGDSEGEEEEVEVSVIEEEGMGRATGFSSLEKKLLPDQGKVSSVSGEGIRPSVPSNGYEKIAVFEENSSSSSCGSIKNIEDGAEKAVSVKRGILKTDTKQPFIKAKSEENDSLSGKMPCDNNSCLRLSRTTLSSPIKIISVQASPSNSGSFVGYELGSGSPKARLSVKHDCAHEKTSDSTSQEGLQLQHSLEDDVFAIGYEGEGDDWGNESTPLVSETSTPSEWSVDGDGNTGEMNHAFSLNILDKDCGSKSEARDVHSWAGDEKENCFKKCPPSCVPHVFPPLNYACDVSKDPCTFYDSRKRNSGNKTPTPQSALNGVGKNMHGLTGKCKRKIYKEKGESNSFPRASILTDFKNRRRGMKNKKRFSEDQDRSCRNEDRQRHLHTVGHSSDEGDSTCQPFEAPIDVLGPAGPSKSEVKDVFHVSSTGEISGEDREVDHQDTGGTDKLKSESNPETSV